MTWRWAFYLGAIANGFALTLITVFYWPPTFLDIHRDGKTRLQQIKELDFVGLLLYGGGLTSFLLGISWGDNPYSWTSGTVLAPLIIGSTNRWSAPLDGPTLIDVQSLLSWSFFHYGRYTAPKRSPNCVLLQCSETCEDSVFRFLPVS